METEQCSCLKPASNQIGYLHQYCSRSVLRPLVFFVSNHQIHATIPTSSKSLKEVKQHMAVFMENQQKLAGAADGVSRCSCASQQSVPPYAQQLWVLGSCCLCE